MQLAPLTQLSHRAELSFNDGLSSGNYSASRWLWLQCAPIHHNQFDAAGLLGHIFDPSLPTGMQLLLLMLHQKLENSLYMQ